MKTIFQAQIIYLTLAIFSYLQAQVLREEYQVYVNNFKKTVKSKDKEKLSQHIRFPLNRRHPIPDIKDKKDFINRYDHIFDKKLINEIINSSTAKDWSEVGWRGIILNQGSVWLDHEGSVIGINHSTKKEEEYKNKIINQLRASIHQSLTNYKKSEAYLETKKFKIRIDELENGKYRYASWSITKSTSEKPDLVLNNGEITLDGNGGNHYFTFINLKYTYEIYVSYIGTDETPPASLTVYKEKDIILEQNAIVFKN